MPYELFSRPREPRGTPGPAALRVTIDRKRIILSAAALLLLPKGVERVHLAVDEDDQALALVPARDDDEKAYAVARNGRQGIVTAVGLIRQYAIAAGRYRAEKSRVFGKDVVAAHYVRSDRVD
jgi:hypothetical protein